MKFSGILWLFLLAFSGTVMVSAETDLQLIERFHPMWKNELFKINGFSEEQFENQIVIKKQAIMHTENSTYYNLEFISKWDWLEVPGYHKVLIRMSSKESAYRHLPIPRDTWFNQKDFTFAIKRKISDTDLIVSPAKPLRYSSLEAAKSEIKSKSGINSFLTAETSFYVPGKLPRVDGEPYLLFSGVKGGGKSSSPMQPKIIKKSGNTGIVPPTIKETKTVPIKSFAPSNCEDQNYICEEEQKEDTRENTFHKTTAISNPAPKVKSRAFCAPEPLGNSLNENCIKGWLNLVTGKISFHEDAINHY